MMNMNNILDFALGEEIRIRFLKRDGKSFKILPKDRLLYHDDRGYYLERFRMSIPKETASRLVAFDGGLFLDTYLPTIPKINGGVV